MAKDLWLPTGYELGGGLRIRSLQSSGDEWQIFNAHGGENILAARPELARKWCERGFLDGSLLKTIPFGAATFHILNSPNRYMLTPVENGKSLTSKEDAMAFAFALKESRRISHDSSFHDSIYVEQYSRLLPTWTLTPHVDDDVVLGTWITGGVTISTKSFRRLASLAGWMSSSDLAEIVEAAGFHVPPDAGVLTKQKPNPQKRSDERTPVAKEAGHPEQRQDHLRKEKSGVFTLPGRPHLESFFNEHVIDIIFNPERYSVLGIDFPSAIVLHGPPGCGKTFAVDKLVEFIDWPNFSIDSSSVGSPYIHETSKKVSEIFNKAIDTAPSVIVIDEMESFLSDRRSGGSSSLHHVEEVAEFLRRIPEALKSKVLIIAMTNMIDLIDPAILRRGRFDHIVEVGMPSRAEVASLLDSLLARLPRSEDLNLGLLLDVLTGKPLSDVAFVVREGARLAAKSGKTQIDQESMLAALKSLPDPKERKSGPMGFVWDK